MRVNLSKTLGRIDPTLWRFAITGSLTVLLDAIVYAALLGLSVPVSWAKSLALVAATIFAYGVNRFWAFRNPQATGNRLIAFLALYVLAIALNVLVNRATFNVLGGATNAYPIAWFCATAASTVWNYVGMRFFVFRPSRNPQ